jgi:hypothetical protein
MMPITFKILRATALMSVVMVSLMGGYVLKSALGINLLPGRSPVVHDLLYPMALTLKAAMKTASPV